MESVSGSSRKTQLLSQHIVDEIVELINNQKYKPGDQLPNEIELSEKLGVARGTLREAVKQLVSRNVLEIRRGKGTFVSQYPGYTEDPWGIELMPDKIPVALELLELREFVEPKLAEKAALNATDEQLRRIDQSCREIVTAMENIQRHRPLELEFHLLIAEASGNTISRLVMRQLFGQSVHLQNKLTGGPVRENFVEAIRTYKLINDALQRRDSKAAYDAMLEQIKTNIDDLHTFKVV